MAAVGWVRVDGRSLGLREGRCGLAEAVVGLGGADTRKPAKTYNTGDSPVVTDRSTNPAVSSLSRGERTGSRVVYCLWSYVIGRTRRSGLWCCCYQCWACKSSRGRGVERFWTRRDAKLWLVGPDCC
ncbi:uncharacterized protein THITE_2042175 [Thermothielavioides terrestris NRRL 8126]|uniref:Uncharacterized protein n=1 Tax=Thermothielavioides terrestris (strain ATCC 38088 / NRRL 8126) TaxID=578455 RepID=G2QVG8_THETT|nr:uncharacterized protein THITE_2042175 [Thermothielavioides terrestris NRRL 8126]AEO64658.1 hypothetical protein THITE_2042175 [Thermothielavioides terrestris NRRL 8126]